MLNIDNQVYQLSVEELRTLRIKIALQYANKEISQDTFMRYDLALLKIIEVKQSGTIDISILNQ